MEGVESGVTEVKNQIRIDLLGWHSQSGSCSDSYLGHDHLWHLQLSTDDGWFSGI